jgi:hypothetical protein
MTIDQYRQYFDEKWALANPEQKMFVNLLLRNARAHFAERLSGQRQDGTSQRLYFLTGDGGTGKSFTYNVHFCLNILFNLFKLKLLISALKRDNINVAPCATTGIAAELLFEGTTVHRRFGPIPQDLSFESDSLIDLESEKANVIRAADVIIIDEVSGMHKVNKINFKFNDLLLLGSVGLFG